MKEIELKIQLTNKQQAMLKSWLATNAKQRGQSHHIEHYLDNPNDSFKFDSNLGYVDSEKYLRIRFSDKANSVCLKIFSIDRETGRSANLGELETAVADGQAMLSILKELGFTNSTVVNKTRQSFSYKNFEIELDEVKGLGSFVEVEVKDHKDDSEAGFAQIYKLLREIGITEFLEQKRGYVSMLWNPSTQFGKSKKI